MKLALITKQLGNETYWYVDGSLAHLHVSSREQARLTTELLAKIEPPKTQDDYNQMQRVLREMGSRNTTATHDRAWFNRNQVFPAVEVPEDLAQKIAYRLATIPTYDGAAIERKPLFAVETEEWLSAMETAL